MEQQLFTWIKSQFSLDPDYAKTAAMLTVLILILLICVILHLVLHKIVLPKISQPTDSSVYKPNGWRSLIRQNKLFNRFAFLIQGVVLNIQALFWLKSGSFAQEVLATAAQAWCLLFVMLILFSILDIMQSIIHRYPTLAKLPLRGIAQSVKLITAIIFSILIISLLIGKSPLILISGLGAMTAVLMLVFKDPIMGLVAGIQLSANNMLNIGDWLEMPKYNADGAVTDIGLTTVKVRNWDNTVTTIPTYALISDSFKNWQGMTDSGGRRIKRSLNVDASSIQFLTEEDIQELSKSQLLAPYISEKLQELTQYNTQNSNVECTPLNHRRLTNIGTFRAYAEAYLHANKNIHKEMTIMARQLAPSSDGIPIEIYAFTNTTAWLVYEQIQSDIFDHLFAILPYFKLRVHQSPTGSDVRFIGANISSELTNALTELKKSQ